MCLQEQPWIMERMSTFEEKGWFVLQDNNDNVSAQDNVWVGLLTAS